VVLSGYNCSSIIGKILPNGSVAERRIRGGRFVSGVACIQRCIRYIATSDCANAYLCGCVLEPPRLLHRFHCTIGVWDQRHLAFVWPVNDGGACFNATQRGGGFRVFCAPIVASGSQMATSTAAIFTSRLHLIRLMVTYATAVAPIFWQDGFWGGLPGLRATHPFPLFADLLARAWVVFFFWR